MTRLVALGHSFSCGEGVGLYVDLGRTWIGLLASGLELDVELHARAGMTASEVAHHQLPHAVGRPAPVTSVLVGLNDMIRFRFDADATRRHVRTIVGRLGAVHDIVLVGRWHNPLTLFALPPSLRDLFAARLHEINAAIDAAVDETRRAVVLDLGSITHLHERDAWAVDRVHPSDGGQRAIAAAAAEVLGRCGLPSPRSSTPGPDGDVGVQISGRDEARWMFRHGVPWMVGRLAKAAVSAVAPADAAEPEGVAASQPGPSRGPAGGEKIVDPREVARTSR